MNVLLVSQCSKNALTETRRILDQFAERRGDRSWQTPITQEGLDTLRRLLRKTARKNTAVACHWIRGRDHSELLWIVGEARRFNTQGATPTNTTTLDILRHHDENDWHTGEDIHLLAALAALLHDLGKACMAFQQRLRPDAPLERNLYRHEWISLRLFQAFVGQDDDRTWLGRLIEPSEEDDATWLRRLCRDSLDATSAVPFKTMAPLASAIGWLVLTHHRLPIMPGSADISGGGRWLGAKVAGFRADMLRDIPGCIEASWNEVCDTANPERIAPYWSFPHGLPITTAKWRIRARHLAQRLLPRLDGEHGDWLDNAYVMHLARLTLMLADHHYSSLSDPEQRVCGEAGYPLWANTLRSTGVPNQPLDEHLLGVEKHSRVVSRSLPRIEHHLPRLTRHKGFRRRSGSEHFRWQDKAYDLAVGLRECSRRQGFFGVNMASTGCGKTLANGRVLYALADPDQGARFSIALGLRTLTLQTGRMYREMLNLGDDDLAVRVGGGASRALFEHYQDLAEATGSASAQSLLAEDSYVHFEGSLDHPLLERLAPDPIVKALLAAPILVCTVDHLTPATEGQRGGRQIAPMLRLMSGDLVLDEPDDFDLADLPALTRLVHWSGMLGSRVVLSSATLPPALTLGLFEAYRDGRAIYRRNRGKPGQTAGICCGWFDEHDRTQADCCNGDAFAEAHQAFVERRHAKLARAPVQRRSELVPLQISARQPDDIRKQFAAAVRTQVQALHARHHSTDPRSGKRVSFGLIRMANIEPLFDVALALYRLGAARGQRIHLCVYHSQFPLLIRSAIEWRLDQALNRRNPEAVFELPDIRRRLDAHGEPDQLFIVLGSPVTEVGRDHDYDWAVVEPSSMRSLIQLAGRVRRHRGGECESPNLSLLDTNLRHLESPGQPAFRNPGFEGAGQFQLNSHCLEALLNRDEWEVVDARPRIKAKERLRPQDSLVDLEHFRLRKCMLALVGEPSAEAPVDPDRLSKRGRKRSQRDAPAPSLGAHTWWSMPRVTLTAVLPQQQPFREDTIKRCDLVLLPDDSGEDYGLMSIQRGQGRKPDLLAPVDTSKNHRVDLDALRGPRIEVWGELDYMQALVALADQRGMELDDCARRFSTVSLPASDQGWRFHPALGFAKQH